VNDEIGQLVDGYNQHLQALNAQRESATELAAAQTARANTENTLITAIEALDEAFVLFDQHDRLLFFNQKYRDIYPATAPAMVTGNTFEAIIRYGAEHGQYPAATGRVEEWVQERLTLHRSGNAVLEQKLDDNRWLAKGQFLANMSHEIRTPMNAVLGLLKLLQDTGMNAAQADLVLKTEGAARSLLGLLNDILDFSKVEAGKMLLDPRPFDLDRMLRDLSTILTPNVGAKSIAVRFEVEPAVPRGLLGDDMRLQQVLINLGGNAIKFTSEGDVVLRVRLLERNEDGVLLEFAVSDSGIGIAPENQVHIFSGFSQAEASTTRRYGGTGLGLAISSRLVELLGGELKLSSVEGKGSVFYFQVRFQLADIPVVEAPLSGVSSAGVTPCQRLQGLRILVVEDNKINQMVARGLLAKEGADITMADDGERGVAAVAASQPAFDVVLMDVQMPVMDGYAATRAIRHTLGLTRLPIIAMTANAMASDREACLAAGMDDHVGKPFDLDELVAVLLRHTRACGYRSGIAATTRLRITPIHRPARCWFRPEKRLAAFGRQHHHAGHHIAPIRPGRAVGAATVTNLSGPGWHK
jgi:signal transduction histidine kinase/CheY-like chemotaxis protein